MGMVAVVALLEAKLKDGADNENDSGNDENDGDDNEKDGS